MFSLDYWIKLFQIVTTIFLLVCLNCKKKVFIYLHLRLNLSSLSSFQFKIAINFHLVSFFKKTVKCFSECFFKTCCLNSPPKPDHRGTADKTALKQSFRENQREEKIRRSIVTGLLLWMEAHSPGKCDISTRRSHKKEQFPGGRGVLTRANKEPEPVAIPPKLARTLAH